MMYLSKEDLVKSIIDDTEKILAVIEATYKQNNISSYDMIIHSLSNIIDSSLVVTALEDENCQNKDCYRNFISLAFDSDSIPMQIKTDIDFIMKTRKKSDSLSSKEFEKFLESYDRFMKYFVLSSPVMIRIVKNRNINKTSLYNMLNIFPKKNTKATPDAPKSKEDMTELMKENNRLLKEILEEKRMTNKKLDDLTKLIKSVYF